MKEADERPEKMYLVVQQGGSTGEWYASLYNDVEAANEAIIGHKKATYNAIGPYELSPALTKALLTDGQAESDLIELLGDVCGDAATENFSELEVPEGEDEEDK